MPIYDVFEFDGRPILTMPFLERGTLADRLASCDVLPVNDVLTVGAELAAVLAVVHKKNIIHRDLKPSNIGFGADGSIRLMDFGIARDLTIPPTGRSPIRFLARRTTSRPNW